MQPTFFSWQGFFELVFQADTFVILDDFQFSLQSFHQRNQLFVNQNQVDWYTVPVLKAFSYGAPLNECQVDESVFWRKKMIQRLRHNYAKAAFFEQIFPKVEQILLSKVTSLADLNIQIIRYILELFQWQKNIRFSSECPSNLKRSWRVLELLEWCKADQYFSAAGSFAYMREDGVFPRKGIEIYFQNFQCKPYRQVGSAADFFSHLSVLDSLFNIGPVETAHIISQGTIKWRSWRCMEVAADRVA